MVSRLGTQKARLDDVLDRFTSTCDVRRTVTSRRLEEIDKILQHADHALINAEYAASTTVALESSLEQMQNNFNRQVRLSLTRPSNCRGIRGYEDDGDPDGLRGTYYPTPYFKCLGIRKFTRLDPVLDFVWTGRPPAAKIPLEAFSVRWEGFIRPPATGTYRLVTQTACGARIYLNKKLILNDRMPEDPYQELGDDDSLGYTKLLGPTGVSGVRKTVSRQIFMNANEKVPIRVEMIHANHLIWRNPDTAVFRLLWLTPPEGKEEPIPLTSFFSGDQHPVLKLSRLKTGVHDIDFLHPGVKPLLDRENVYIGDLSASLEGSKLIKMRRDIQEQPLAENIEIEVNIPSKLFVGYAEDRIPITLVDSGVAGVAFKPTNMTVALLDAPSPSSRATASLFLKIDEGVLPSRGIYKFTAAKSKKPWIIFLQAQPRSDEMCAGPVIILSDPSGGLYSKCRSSSVSSEEYNCDFGLNMRHRDVPFGVWKTAPGQNTGQFVEVFFKKKVKLTGFRFKPLDDPASWPGELIVSTGPSTQAFTLIYSSNMDLLNYDMAPVTTDYVKLQVSQMYVDGPATGGSFELLGSECEDRHRSPLNDQFYETNIPIFAVTECTATLANILDFPNPHPDMLVSIDCPANCGPVNVPAVFGTNVYSADSAICLAAVHSDACNGSRKKCSFTMRYVSGQVRYQGTTRHGIRSHDHGPHDISFVLEPRGAMEQAALGDRLTPLAANTPKGRWVVLFHAIDPEMPILPKGVAIDAGDIFGDRDEFDYPRYGWIRNVTPVSCAVQPNVGSDPFVVWANSGAIAFPPNPKSKACDALDCSPNVWSIELSAGMRVSVSVQLGDPCGDKETTNKYWLQIGGEDVVRGEKIRGGEHFFANVAEHVIGSDGKLRISGICDDVEDCGTYVIAIKIAER